MTKTWPFKPIDLTNNQIDVGALRQLMRIEGLTPGLDIITLSYQPAKLTDIIWFTDIEGNLLKARKEDDGKVWIQVRLSKISGENLYKRRQPPSGGLFNG